MVDNDVSGSSEHRWAVKLHIVWTFGHPPQESSSRNGRRKFLAPIVASQSVNISGILRLPRSKSASIIGCALKLFDDLESELIASIRRLIGSGSRNQHRLLLPLPVAHSTFWRLDIHEHHHATTVRSGWCGAICKKASFPPFFQKQAKDKNTKLKHLVFQFKTLKICVLGGAKKRWGDDDDGVVCGLLLMLMMRRWRWSWQYSTEYWLPVLPAIMAVRVCTTEWEIIVGFMVSDEHEGALLFCREKFFHNWTLPWTHQTGVKWRKNWAPHVLSLKILLKQKIRKNHRKLQNPSWDPLLFNFPKIFFKSREIRCCIDSHKIQNQYSKQTR